MFQTFSHLTFLSRPSMSLKTFHFLYFKEFKGLKLSNRVNSTLNFLGWLFMCLILATPYGAWRDRAVLALKLVLSYAKLACQPLEPPSWSWGDTF